MNRPLSLRDLAYGFVGLVMLGAMATTTILAAAGLALAWVLNPLAAAALTVSHLAVFTMGLSVRDRRRKQLAEVSEWHDEEIDAIKLADTRRDSGDQPAVELYDQDAQGEKCGWCGEPAVEVLVGEHSDLPACLHHAAECEAEYSSLGTYTRRLS